MRRLLLSLLLLFIVAIWGWTFVLVKDAVAVYGVVPFLLVRFVIGLVCVGMISVWYADRQSLQVGSLIGVVLAAAYLLQTLGLDRTTATNTGLITGLAVVFAPLANRLLFGVKTGRALWAAIGVSVFGLALLTGAGPDGLQWGDLMTLGCAAGFGLHIALLDRYSQHHRTGVLVLGQLAAATLIFGGIYVPHGLPPQPSGEVWVALLITGAIATAAGFYVQTFVQQRLSAVETAMIILLEPVFAILFGYLLHGDRLSGLQIVGALLMVTAVFAVEIYSQLRNGRQRNTIRSAGSPD